MLIFGLRCSRRRSDDVTSSSEMMVMSVVGGVLRDGDMVMSVAGGVLPLLHDGDMSVGGGVLRAGDLGRRSVQGESYSILLVHTAFESHLTNIVFFPLKALYQSDIGSQTL
jgi:hypothetical protein